VCPKEFLLRSPITTTPGSRCREKLRTRTHTWNRLWFVACDNSWRKKSI